MDRAKGSAEDDDDDGRTGYRSLVLSHRWGTIRVRASLTEQLNLSNSTITGLYREIERTNNKFLLKYGETTTLLRKNDAKLDGKLVEAV